MAYPYITDAINDFIGTDFHLPINTFGAFVALGLGIGVYITQTELIRLINTNRLTGLSPAQAKNTASELAFVTTIFGIFGAKLFDVIEQLDRLLKDPIEVIFSTGGFSIYGGLIFGMLTGIIYIKRKSIPVLPTLDAVSPALALGYGVGRIGCQFSGDGDWGKEASMELKPDWLPDWLWAQTYPNNVLNVDIPFPGVYPTPIYEAVAAFMLFAFLWVLRSKLKITGQLFFIYLIISSLTRWLIEIIRINSQYEILGFYLSQAQIISLVLIVMGITALMMLNRANKNTIIYTRIQ